MAKALLRVIHNDPEHVIRALVGEEAQPKKRKPVPEMLDAENPEWTEAKAARAVPFTALPELLRKTLAGCKRGPQKAPTKK